MLHAMNRTPAATTSLVLLSSFWVCGCSSNKKAVEPAADVLGPGGGLRPVRPDAGRGMELPAARRVDRRPTRRSSSSRRRPARHLAKVLLDPATYTEYARGGAFERAVGYRVWRGDQNVEFYLSFNNDQLYSSTPATPAASPPAPPASRTPAPSCCAVTHEAFPECKAPDAPKLRR